MFWNKKTKLTIDEWLGLQNELEKYYDKMFKKRLDIMDEAEDLKEPENELMTLIKSFAPALGINVPKNATQSDLIALALNNREKIENLFKGSKQ